MHVMLLNVKNEICRFSNDHGHTFAGLPATPSIVAQVHCEEGGENEDKDLDKVVPLSENLSSINNRDQRYVKLQYINKAMELVLLPLVSGPKIRFGVEVRNNLWVLHQNIIKNLLLPYSRGKTFGRIKRCKKDITFRKMSIHK